MLEATQACSQKQTPDVESPGALSGAPEFRHQSQRVSAQELAPLRFGQSRRLWQWELVLYLAMLLCASLAIFPFLFTTWYWPIAWLAFALLLGWQGRSCWRREFSTRLLSRINGRWYLRDIGGEQEIALCDEILLWSQLIILPVRRADGRKTHLLLTPDAMDADDWRRLRVFLRYLAG